MTMSWYGAAALVVTLANQAGVMAQSTNQPNLPDFLSAVQSIASVLQPTTSSTSSSTFASTTSSPTQNPSTSSSSTDNAATSPVAAATSSIPSSDSAGVSSGLDPHTRNIILGVTIPLGLILLAALILLLVLCCRRRRRRTRRVSSPDEKFAGNNDWERGNTAHHGFNSSSSLRTGHTNIGGQNTHHDAAPLMGTNHHTAPFMSQHPAYRNSSENPNTENPFTPNPPIARKPVPNRGSTGSNISGISGNHHNNHHGGVAAGAGAGGALAGAALMHHHDKRRQSNGSQGRPQSWHRPLSSHPHDPPMYTTSGHPNEVFGHEQRRTSTPFSPDDVGSLHRKSPRFSQGAIEPTVAAHHNEAGLPYGAIVAPTMDQRRSLQSRNSSYSDGGEISRGPSRSPKRRSLSGGGEMWQAEPAMPPVMPVTNRHSGSEIRHTNSAMAPALPSNRHLVRSQKPDLYDANYSSNTNSSTSNDSWESAQANINPWDDRDPGRYPRFSGGSGASHSPLIAPPAAWDDKRERRWSGDMFNRSSGDTYRGFHTEPRRNSGGVDKRKLRFSDGQPELYNEHGLVGRAL